MCESSKAAWEIVLPIILPFSKVCLALYINGKKEGPRAKWLTQRYTAHKSEVMDKILSPDQNGILKILETWQDQIENMQIPIGTGRN